MKTIIVVMPAYNEADGIVDFISELHEAFNYLGLSVSFYVQNDCSTDLTLEKLADLSTRASINLILQTNVENLGHGPTSHAALSYGANSTADYVLHVDGDGQFSTADIMSVVQAGLESNNPTVGRRITRSDPYYRKVLTKSLRMWVSIIGKTLKIEDANSPLRFQSVESLRETLIRIPVDALIPSIWWSVLTSEQKIEYVPVRSIDRRGESVTGTMWGKASRFRGLIPSRRLVTFCWHSLFESFQLLRKG